jgi:hypothetical protein
VLGDFRAKPISKLTLGLLAVVAPGAAYLLVVELVSGHAEKEYFEAVAQILPVLLLALAVEQRYFTRNVVAPESPLEIKEVDHRLKDAAKWYTRMARAYALIVLILLGQGEWISVEVLATGSSSASDLSTTAGSLAAGFTALIVSALVGTRSGTASRGE